MSTRTYVEFNHDVAQPETWGEVELAALGQLMRSGHTDFPKVLRRMGLDVVYQRHHSDKCPCESQREHWRAQMAKDDRCDLAAVLRRRSEKRV